MNQIIHKRKCTGCGACVNRCPKGALYLEADEEGFLSASAFCGRDDMEISVYGTPERILLVSRFDNLGKGASGAAIQNMNIVLGADEALGLIRG